MTAAWIIVLLIVAFVCTRIFRSTKMWWIFMSAIMAGLLVGMLSKEAVKQSKKTGITASITQLIDIVDNGNDACTQCVVTVTEGSTSRPGAVSYIALFTEPFMSDVLVSNHITKGRDSPDIEDDS